MSDIRKELVTTVFTTPKQLRKIADALEKRLSDRAGVCGSSTVVHTWSSEEGYDRVQVAADLEALGHSSSVKAKTSPGARARIVKSGEENRAREVGEQLARLEEKQYEVNHIMFRLRMQYNLDCYAADIEPVPEFTPPRDKLILATNLRSYAALERANFRVRKKANG